MALSEIKGKVHSFETFGLVDGPGVRFVVFMQGCALRCRFCHNPETWAMSGGEGEFTAQEVFNKAYRYKTYWRNNGGLTVSGGEPLLQLEFVTELFRIAKSKGVETCLDTSGGPFKNTKEYLEKFDELMKYTDIIMLDIKEIDADKHRSLTGMSNDHILEMGRHMASLGKRIWIRHVLVPGLTDDKEGLERTNEYIKSLGKVEKVEILPYHTLGLFKWEKLGIPYTLDGVRAPTDEEVKEAENILQIT